MKKTVVVIALLLGLCALVSPPAWAIIADGIVSPGEWSGYRLQLTDPDEGLVPQNYDDHYFWVADGTELFFRFDVFGSPTFASQGGQQGNPAFYQVYLDFTGDNTAEYRITYRNTGVTIDQWLSGVWTQTGTGTGGMANVVEIAAPGHLFDEYAPVCHETEVWVKAYLDGGGPAPDDDIPDLDGQGNWVWEHTGVHITPEPSSVALLGIGLLSLGAGVFRKKFKA